MFGFFKLFGKKRTPSQPAGTMTGADIAAAWEAEHVLRSGDSERPAQLPAWALILRSPYGGWDGATSWLGGAPHAPADLVWPRSAQGKPLHFHAQIDLSALAPEPVTGARPPGLPPDGALLVFASDASFAAIVLSPADMARAVSLPTPPDLEPLRSIGHWTDDTSFPRWPVDPVPFLDDGSNATPFKTCDFADPLQWITTWGMAAHEAADVLRNCEKLQHDVKRAAAISTAGNQSTSQRNERVKAFTSRAAEPAFRQMLDQLRAWHDLAMSMPPEDPVDAQGLLAIMDERRRLVEGLATFPEVLSLRGRPAEIWRTLLGTKVTQPDESVKRLIDCLRTRDTVGVPPGLRQFVEANIAQWKGHKLFGLLRDLEFTIEDRRGHDPYFTMFSHDLLQTQREHSHATSIWVPREAQSRGEPGGGLLILHGNG